jgi:hypothetical protein
MIFTTTCLADMLAEQQAAVKIHEIELLNVNMANT